MRMSHTIRRQPVGPLCCNKHTLSSPPLETSPHRHTNSSPRRIFLNMSRSVDQINSVLSFFHDRSSPRLPSVISKSLEKRLRARPRDRLTLKKKTPNWLQMPSARGGDEERQRRGMHKMCEGGDRRRVKEAACGGRRTRKNMRESRREEEAVAVMGGEQETWSCGEEKSRCDAERKTIGRKH